MSEHSAPQNPPPAGKNLPLPLGKPFWVYVLLASIGIVFVIEQSFPLFAKSIIPYLPDFYRGVTPADFKGGSTSNVVLILMGANVRELITKGELWRFFTSMFLHIGFQHLLFNAFALFIFGAETERIFGRTRFIIIYVLSGLFGSLTSFVLGSAGLSAGASGAIFGIVGMQVAYFYKNKALLGNFGRSRLTNAAVIVAINLVFGITVPGIDNWAHMGGLISGTLIAFLFMPKYKLTDPFTSATRVIDSEPPAKQWWIPALAFIILSALTQLALWMA